MVTKRQQEWRAVNSDRVDASRKKWLAANPGKAHEQLMISRKRLKLAVIEAYGGKCECCKEDQPEFLTLDHKHGGGRKHRAELGSGNALYSLLRKQGYPQGDYRILCFNCNCAIGLFGFCPHERYKG